MARKPRKKKEALVYHKSPEIVRTLDPESKYIRRNGRVLVGMVNGHLFNIQFDYTKNELVDFINSLELTKSQKRLCWLNLKNRVDS